MLRYEHGFLLKFQKYVAMWCPSNASITPHSFIEKYFVLLFCYWIPLLLAHQSLGKSGTLEIRSFWVGAYAEIAFAPNTSFSTISTLKLRVTIYTITWLGLLITFCTAIASQNITSHFYWLGKIKLIIFLFPKNLTAKLITKTDEIANFIFQFSETNKMTRI